VTELRKPRWSWIAAIIAVLVLAGVVWGWTTQSGYYAIWPDKAHPAAQYVHVPGGTPPAGSSGFYFVDVHLLEANRIEAQYFKHLVTGAQLIPVQSERPPGQSQAQFEAADLQAMDSSQRIAQAVAERALGMPVTIKRLGLTVTAVQPKYPAAKAGVQPGEVLTRINGTPVMSEADLAKASAGVDAGDVASYTFTSLGTKKIRTVAIPGSKSSRGIIGIGIADAARITHLPVHVKFSTQGIGGPSAGLAFTLEIYDSLSHRHLLDGHRIAVTGEIGLDGSVEEIGGATQKTLGAISAGADTFIVPAGANFRDAKKAAKGRIRVIGVTSFDQALKVIRGLPPVSSGS
jgi:PDZ domain-containing protein